MIIFIYKWLKKIYFSISPVMRGLFEKLICKETHDHLCLSAFPTRYVCPEPALVNDHFKSIKYVVHLICIQEMRFLTRCARSIVGNDCEKTIILVSN
jgi:hypothetical protein